MADISFARFMLATLALLIAGCERSPVNFEKSKPSEKLASSIYPGGALDAECSHSGKRADGSHQFILTCPMKVRSPDGNFALVQSPAIGKDEFYQVFVEDRSGRKIGDVPGLNDGFPFVLRWSPKQHWFLVNHWVGSFMERPRVFEIRGSSVVEHKAFQRNVQELAAERFPCLTQLKGDWMNGTAWTWSSDGTRFASIFYTRTDSCLVDRPDGGSEISGNWDPLSMIVDAATGEIQSDSVRMQSDTNDGMPNDGPYADF